MSVIAGMGPNPTHNVESRTAPVGVTSSISISLPRTGMPLRETSRRLNAVDAIVMSNADSQGSIKQGYLPPVFNMQLSGDVFVFFA